MTEIGSITLQNVYLPQTSSSGKLGFDSLIIIPFNSFVNLHICLDLLRFSVFIFKGVR